MTDTKAEIPVLKPEQMDRLTTIFARAVYRIRKEQRRVQKQNDDNRSQQQPVTGGQ